MSYPNLLKGSLTNKMMDTTLVINVNEISLIIKEQKIFSQFIQWLTGPIL